MYSSIKSFQEARHVDFSHQIKAVHVLFMVGLLDYTSSSKAFDFPRYLIMIHMKTLDHKERNLCEQRLIEIRNNLKAIENDLEFLQRALQKVKKDPTRSPVVVLDKLTHECFLADKNTWTGNKIQFTNFRYASLPQRKNILIEDVELHSPRAYYQFSLDSLMDGIEKAIRIAKSLSDCIVTGDDMALNIIRFKNKQDEIITTLNKNVLKKNENELKILNDFKIAMPSAQYPEISPNTQTTFQ